MPFEETLVSLGTDNGLISYGIYFYGGIELILVVPDIKVNLNKVMQEIIKHRKLCFIIKQMQYYLQLKLYSLHTPRES